MTISLTGFMGCGKSSTGRALAERLGARFMDLDAEIVARDGRTIPEIFREGGEAAFRAVELETLRAVLDEAAQAPGDVVLALGGGTLTVPAAREIILAETECVFLRTRFETIRAHLHAGAPCRRHRRPHARRRRRRHSRAAIAPALRQGRCRGRGRDDSRCARWALPDQRHNHSHVKG